MRSKIGKTSTIDVALGKSGKEGDACFLDVSYKNDNYGGNQNKVILTLKNVGGNPFNIKYTEYHNLQEHEFSLEDVFSISIEIGGTFERDDLIRGLQMILDAEKMSELMDPGY